MNRASSGTWLWVSDQVENTQILHFSPLDTLLNDYELQWYKIENAYILGTKIHIRWRVSKRSFNEKGNLEHKFQENSINLMTVQILHKS